MCSVVSASLQSHGLYSPWNSLGKSTGVGSLSLLQGIFPTQGSNPLQVGSLPAEPQEKPMMYVGQIIMLCTLKLYGVVCQLYLIKTERRNVYV